MNSVLVTKLIDWFKINKRDLPWRHNRTFYRVWVSEVMCQQTQVVTVIPYYIRFMERFPTVEALANAHLDDVLKHWEGLGYYSRARNLHKGSRYIISELNGQFPENYEDTIKIPGFGPYTTAAVLSFSAGNVHAVVDGNVIRVISRLFAIDEDMRQEKNKKQIQSLMDQLIPKTDPATFNEAVMEFGALVCTPKTPDCRTCHLNTQCKSYAIDRVREIPFKSKKAAVPTKVQSVAIIYFESKLLIEQRSTEEMLGGLWRFPEEIGDRFEKDVYSDKLQKICMLDEVKHAYSHFKLRLNGIVFKSLKAFPLENNQKWVTLNELDNYAFDTASKKMIEKIVQVHKGASKKLIYIDV